MLVQAAKRVAQGLLGERVPVSGPREVEELGAAFNRMSLALREAHELLEERIRARTAELQRSQEFAELLVNPLDLRVVVMDVGLRIVQANRAALALHGPGLVGLGYAEAFEPPGEAREELPAVRSFTLGQPAPAERTSPPSRARRSSSWRASPSAPPAAGSRR